MPRILAEQPCTRYKDRETQCSCKPAKIPTTNVLRSDPTRDYQIEVQTLLAPWLYFPNNERRRETAKDYPPSVDTNGVIPLRFARPC